MTGRVSGRRQKARKVGRANPRLYFSFVSFLCLFEYPSLRLADDGEEETGYDP